MTDSDTRQKLLDALKACYPENGEQIAYITCGLLDLTIETLAALPAPPGDTPEIVYAFSGANLRRVIDPTVPPGVAELRDDDGRVLGIITNLAAAPPGDLVGADELRAALREILALDPYGDMDDHDVLVTAQGIAHAALTSGTTKEDEDG